MRAIKRMISAGLCAALLLGTAGAHLHQEGQLTDGKRIIRISHGQSERIRSILVCLRSKNM